jgi:predicted ATPase
VGEQLFSLARRIQDPALLVEAHFALGQTLFWLGEFALARDHTEQGVRLYNPQQHRSYAFLYGQDSGMACLHYAAFALWHLGYPDQALKRMHDALTLVQELSHPYSRAGALVIAAMLHQFRREGRAAQEWAKAGIALSSEQAFPFLLVRGTILQGWALAEQGRIEEGIAQIRQELAALRAMGAEVFRLYALTLLAEAYGKAEQIEEGLSILVEALTMVNKSGERWSEAELYRLKGQLLLRSQASRRVGMAHQDVSSVEAGTVGGAHPTGEDEAESCFLKAIEVARWQQAKSLELRAVMSLSRFVAAAGEESRSPADTGRDLRLVHRGV